VDSGKTKPRVVNEVLEQVCSQKVFGRVAICPSNYICSESDEVSIEPGEHPVGTVGAVFHVAAGVET